MKKIICLITVTLSILVFNETECKNIEKFYFYKLTDKADTIKIGYFKSLGNEVKMSSCHLFQSNQYKKENKFLCVGDFGNCVWVKINGKVEMFYAIKIKENKNIFLFKNKNYKLKIEIKQTTGRSYEMFEAEGILTLENNLGLVVTQRFIGSCGC